jgi:tetratricopeptide (TPR) repeat protein
LCGIAEGAQLYRMKRFREAREVYTALLPIARELGDPHAEASLHHNIGHTSIEISDFTLAETHLATAVELFTTMGGVLNAARAEAVRGVLFARRGEYRRAVTHIGAVRRLFLQHGLVEEAGLFGLEIVQARLSLGDYNAAESLAREIVAEFTGAHLNTRAIVALGYLTEAIAARRASMALIGGVRDFIVSLRKHPEREFTACA